MPISIKAQKINPVKRLVKALQNYTKPSSKCFVVGGFVRDRLLRIKPNDVDLEVFGVSQNVLDKIIIETFPQANIVQSKKFGTWTVKSKLSDINISLPRTETKTGKGYFGFGIKLDPALSIKQAASRRDFTINALYLNPLTDEIIDPCKGLKDIQTSTLRAVNLVTFSDDPLRLYRAIQLVARFSLRVEPKTLELLKKMAKNPEIRTLSTKRVESVLRKMYTKNSNPKLGLELAQKLNLSLPNIS